MAHKRLPRIERDVDIEVQEDESAHMWAISYSDFLMTLLCFFVLFFSVDGDKKNAIFEALSKTFNEKTEAARQPQNDGELQFTNLQNLASLNEVKLIQEKENILILLNENIFKPSSHILSHKNTDVLTTVLTALQAYKNQINIYFIGHTDSIPLQKNLGQLTIDNNILASLRASTALTQAKKMGFEESQLFTQSDSANTRNSRSISIRVEPKGGTHE